MRSIFYTLALLLTVVIGILVMNSHAIQVFGVSPNIAISLFALFCIFGIRFGEVTFLTISTLLISYILFPFWFPEFLLLAISWIAMAVLRGRLTGNNFSDAVILSAIGTILFSFLLYFFTDSALLLLPILGEIIYNTLLACILFVPVKKIATR